MIERRKGGRREEDVEGELRLPSALLRFVCLLPQHPAQTQSVVLLSPSFSLVRSRVDGSPPHIQAIYLGPRFLQSIRLLHILAPPSALSPPITETCIDSRSTVKCAYRRSLRPDLTTTIPFGGSQGGSKSSSQKSSRRELTFPPFSSLTASSARSRARSLIFSPLDTFSQSDLDIKLALFPFWSLACTFHGDVSYYLPSNSSDNHLLRHSVPGHPFLVTSEVCGLRDPAFTSVDFSPCTDSRVLTSRLLAFSQHSPIPHISRVLPSGLIITITT